MAQLDHTALFACKINPENIIYVFKVDSVWLAKLTFMPLKKL